MFRTILGASASVVALVSPAYATNTDDPQTEIIVNGQRDKLKLDRKSDTGSR
jgi:iron complex outermembrane receptor protein